MVEGQSYDLFGIRNCDYEVYQIPEYHEIGFRIGLTIGNKEETTLALIEIECATTKAEPRPDQNWSSLQVCYLKNCIYTGDCQKYGLVIKNFKIISADEHKRFLWLSDAEEWPNSIDDELFTVEKSSGSVFGYQIRPEDKEIGSRDTFCGDFLDKWNRTLNYLEEASESTSLLMVDESFSHRIITEQPKMHL